MAASGPGLKAGGRLETARVVDVAPTIWQMLGVGGGEAALDGQSLLEQSKRAPETGAKRQ